MDLTAEAIQQIQADQTVLLQAQQGSLNTDQPTVILPKKYQVASLEKFNEKRKFFRGKFATTKVADYKSYLESQSQKLSVFVNGLSSRCVVDLGTKDEAGGCRHQALLAVSQRPEYRIFHGKLNSKLSQRELSEFIEDFAEYISLQHNEEGLDLVKSINAIRKVTIAAASERTQTEGNLGKSRSTFDSIEAKSADAQLPTVLYFSCRVADGFTARDFKCRISVLTSRDEVEFIIRPTNLENQMEEVEKELGDMLALIPEATIFYGDIDVS